MSPLAHAVRHRFEDVYARELLRLRRKTASLAPADRAVVQAVSEQVMQAFSASIVALVDGHRGPEMEQIVRRVFALAPAESTASRREAPEHLNGSIRR